MICRLCLISLNSDNSVLLFDAYDAETQLIKIIAKYVHLEITRQDDISTTICQECSNQLTAFHKYCAYVEQQQSALSNKFLVKFNNHSSAKDGHSEFQEPMELQLKCEPEDEFVAETGAEMRHEKYNISYPSIDSGSSRKLTISNKDQIRLLVDEMEQNPAIARGQRPFGQSKQANDNFWEHLSNELNSLGPPVRKRQDWQRVWTNYKQNLRRKISKNRHNVQATGGGASEEVPLTVLEKTVADLLITGTTVSPAGQFIGVNIEEDVGEHCSNVADENAPPPPSPTPPRTSHTPEVDKRPKTKAIEEQTRNQVEIIKKLAAIEKCCRKNYKISKRILEIKKQKLLLLQNKEEDEAKLRKLDIELGQKKLLKAQ